MEKIEKLKETLKEYQSKHKKESRQVRLQLKTNVTLKSGKEQYRKDIDEARNNATKALDEFDVLKMLSNRHEIKYRKLSRKQEKKKITEGSNSQKETNINEDNPKEKRKRKQKKSSYSDLELFSSKNIKLDIISNRHEIEFWKLSSKQAKQTITEGSNIPKETNINEDNLKKRKRKQTKSSYLDLELVSSKNQTHHVKSKFKEKLKDKIGKSVTAESNTLTADINFPNESRTLAQKGVRVS